MSSVEQGTTSAVERAKEIELAQYTTALSNEQFGAFTAAVDRDGKQNDALAYSIAKSRKQVALTYLIGYAEPQPDFEVAVAGLASTLCGGCTTSLHSGWWTADGAEHKQEFAEPAQLEICFKLELSCELDKRDRVMQVMKAGIAGWAEHFDVDTDWVHVKEVEFTGHHFSIKKESAKLSHRAMQVAAMSR